MSEQTYYCNVCGFEGEGVKPAFCPRCDFALRNDAPFAESCEFCVQVENQQCNAINPDGFVCTRKAEHKGEHVACAYDLGHHNIARWPNAAFYSEEEWAATIRYAEEHAAEFATPNPNYPLPLTELDIEILKAQYTARTIDWVNERIFGRNTP